MGLRLRIGESHELIPWHRIIALKCDPVECMLVYKPECFGYVEQIWKHLAASRNDTSLTEDRCCFTGDGDPRKCDPKIPLLAATAREAYTEFIDAFGCGQERRTITFLAETQNYQIATEACKAKN
jgi:hypothetical protein